MLGYSYTNSNNNELNSLTTFPQTVYSPGTGVAGNLLTPGVYMISMYNYQATNTSATASNMNLAFGVCRSTGTAPATNTLVDRVVLASVQTSTGGDVKAYFPTFVFTVTTNGYYYAFTSAGLTGIPTVTGAGATYTIGARITSLVRIG